MKDKYNITKFTEYILNKKIIIKSRFDGFDNFGPIAIEYLFCIVNNNNLEKYECRKVGSEISSINLYDAWEFYNDKSKNNYIRKNYNNIISSKDFNELFL
jgi:hypothetical protein